jgi:hypothetical protein
MGKASFLGIALALIPVVARLPALGDGKRPDLFSGYS